MKIVVLIAKKAGSEWWGIRNDRFAFDKDTPLDSSKKVEHMTKVAEQEKMRWEKIEPDTEFRVLTIGQEEAASQRYLEEQL